MHDPGFFQVLWSAAGAVETVNRCLGLGLVGLDYPHAQSWPRQQSRRGMPLEAVEQLRAAFAQAHHHWRQLPVLPQGTGHGLLRRRLGQSITAITLSQVLDGQRLYCALRPGTHDTFSWSSEVERGAEMRPDTPAPLSPLGLGKIKSAERTRNM